MEIPLPFHAFILWGLYDWLVLKNVSHILKQVFRTYRAVPILFDKALDERHPPLRPFGPLARESRTRERALHFPGRWEQARLDSRLQSRLGRILEPLLAICKQ